MTLNDTALSGFWPGQCRFCRSLWSQGAALPGSHAVVASFDSRLPVLTPLFNRNGRFFLFCTGGGQPIGFLRIQNAPGNAAELVVAIGEESMWGQGYGRACLTEALKVAFFDLRREKVIAHIYKDNIRSRNMFVSRGFVPCKAGGELTEYQLTYSDYLHPQHCAREIIA